MSQQRVATRWRRGLWAGLVGSALIACVPALAGDPDSSPHGFLYRVSKEGGAVLYLYGTLHVGRPKGPGLDAPTTAVIASCQHVAIELDPRNLASISAALQKYAVYLAGDSLAAHIPADLDQRAMAQADVVRLPRERAEKTKPWVLANFLSVLNLSLHGFDPRRSSEALLVTEATHDHADVIEIEGAAAQMNLLGSAPDEVQVDALNKTVSQIEDGHIADEAAQLLDAWQHSDAAAIERILSGLTTEPGPYAQFMADQVLGRRNQAMADVAERQIKAPGVTFFAVGALHLFGEPGLVAELRRRGYSVTPLFAAPTS